MLLGALDHLDGVAEHLFGPVDQRTRVAAIHEHGLDGVEAAEQPHQHGTGRHAVLDAGRVYDHRQQIALRVYRDMPLASLDLFARVITAPPPFRAACCPRAPILRSRAKRGIADTPSAREESRLASAATGNRSSPHTERHPQPAAMDTSAAALRRGVLPEALSAKAPAWPTEHLSNHSDTCTYVKHTNLPRICLPGFLR